MVTVWGHRGRYCVMDDEPQKHYYTQLEDRVSYKFGMDNEKDGKQC